MRGDMRPRLFQGGTPDEIMNAERMFRTAEVGGIRPGVTPAELRELSRLLQAKNISAFSAEEMALLQRVTMVHSQVAGATPSSPLLSMTELVPEEALRQLPPTATNRAYVVRVRMNPDDVARVNDILGDAEGAGRLAGELEVVAGRDLANPANARILSIRANPGGMLGGTAGTVLRAAGTIMMVIGAAMTAREVLTASGPHRREIQGRATGAFAGGVAAGAFATGLCIGLGVVTAGVAILACGLGAGILGAIGGGAAGGYFGSLFD
jgi:hypothetical protein